MGHTICRHLHNNVDGSNVQVECKFVTGGFQDTFGDVESLATLQEGFSVSNPYHGQL